MGYPVTKNRMVDGGDTWIIGGDIKRDGAVEGSDAGAVSVVLPVHYSLDPDAVSATYVHAAVTLGADAQDVTTGITNPDFPHIVYNAAFLQVKLFDGSTDSGTLSVDADELEKNLFSLNGTPNGAKVLDLIYLK